MRVPAVAVSVGSHHPTDEMLENCTKIIQDVCVKAVPEMERTTLLERQPACDSSHRDMKGLKVTRLGPRDMTKTSDILVNPREGEIFLVQRKTGGIQRSGLRISGYDGTQQISYV